MDSKLRERCDRQLENEKALRNMSSLEAESSIKVGSLLYTSMNLPVNDSSMDASKKILAEKAHLFPNVRGFLLTLILIRMSISDDPEIYIDTIIRIYNRLEKDSGISGLFTVITSVILMEEYKNRDIDQAVQQVLDLFRQINERHPDRVNASELAYVALMLSAGKADTRLEDEKEKIAAALKAKLQVSDDTARAISLVLMTNSAPADVKVDGFITFYNQLNETGHATGKNQYMSIYGAFVELGFLDALGIPESETIASLAEVDEYLKKKPGYGRFSIHKDMRKVIAAALTLQHYTLEIPLEKHTVFHSDTSMELRLFIVLMSLVVIK